MARTTAAGMAGAGKGKGKADAPAPAPELDIEVTEENPGLQRLANIVADAEFDSGTILGDLNEVILDLFKHRPKVWSAMSQGEQQDAIRFVQKATPEILLKIVALVVEAGSTSITATLESYSAKDGFKITLKAASDEDTALQLFKLEGHRVCLLSADDKRFAGTRREPEVDLDQPDLGFADAPTDTDKPTPPADDNDLAGGNDDDEASDEAAPKFRIFDTKLGQYLDLAEDDFTGNIANAGSWSDKLAQELIDGFEDNGDMELRPVADDPTPVED